MLSPNATVVSAATDSDVVILIVGEKTTDNDNKGNTGGEGKDRTTIKLPGNQQQLVDAVVAVGKPTIVVVMSGGSVTVENVAGKDHVALVYAGFGGESGATALTNVLTGKYNPSGRLAFTVYPSEWETQTSKEDMSMQAGSGRSYRYFNGTAIFPFGAGISYTTFGITMAGDEVVMGRTVLGAGDSKTYTINVANTGKIAGATSVLVYITKKTARASSGHDTDSVHHGADSPALPTIVPLKELVTFDSCSLAAGGSTTIAFTIGPEELGLYNDIGSKAVYVGDYTVEFSALGGSSVSADLSVTTTTTLETIPPVDNRPV
jgi:beta-glucosidase